MNSPDSCWQILELSPTPDTRTIKKAYARLLKSIDQDTQPEQFIQLRQALEEAVAEAAWMEDVAEEEADSPVIDDSLSLNKDSASDLLASALKNKEALQEMKVLTEAPPQYSPLSLQERVSQLATRIRQQETSTHLQSDLQYLFQQISEQVTNTSLHQQLVSQLDQAAQEAGLEGIQTLLPEYGTLLNANPAESENLYRLLEELQEMLVSTEIDKNTLNSLYQLLETVPVRPLGVQLEIHDWLLWRVVNVYLDSKHLVPYERQELLGRWTAIFGIENINPHSHENIIQFSIRQQELASEAENWSRIPLAFRPSLEKLLRGDLLTFAEVLKLRFTQNPVIRSLRDQEWQQLNKISGPVKDANRYYLQCIFRTDRVLPLWLFSIAIFVLGSGKPDETSLKLKLLGSIFFLGPVMWLFMLPLIVRQLRKWK